MCETIYIWLHSILGKKVYSGDVSIDTRIVEMFHAHTDLKSKERIMSNFCQRNSSIRVLIATIACGMGIDIPDVSIVVLWGLPTSLLQMWQQMGRCGRDGRKSLFINYAYQRSI